MTAAVAANDNFAPATAGPRRVVAAVPATIVPRMQAAFARHVGGGALREQVLALTRAAPWGVVRPSGVPLRLRIA